ncbi:phospholipase D3-like isoform X3 [Varroa destructor]|nr:phospholipase D3-like isoform X3 [Varroa destructor]XP_022656824.1 phospholipase D3-like isoform X3 [Varroa destructor]XP_022656825.1 phospholipase D3-like isoform X3 [Varroa destructor]XP_022656826.1 phospholipase D3-like isoform X3 [Varroa destructor]
MKVIYKRPNQYISRLSMTSMFLLLVPLLALRTSVAVGLDDCCFSLVESVPEELTFPSGSPVHPTTHQTWMNLISKAQSNIDIASFYWTLRNKDISPGDNSSWMGEEVFAALLNTGIRGNAKIRIVQNIPSKINPATDTADFVKLGAADVQTLDFDEIFGAGLLHTKFWVVDDTHIFIGSANMDYRSLSQVKELGAVIYNCPSLALDLKKVFEIYWTVGVLGTVPSNWPDSFSTQYNAKTPLPVNLNNSAAQVYISSSPPPFSPKGRSDDLESILAGINEAEEFIYVAVMDFYPQMIYDSPKKGELWLVLETALKRAAIERKVQVRLLVSEWQSTKPEMKAFVASLGELGKVFSIQTKKFVVPPLSRNRIIPFSRVNHNKYMVTDKRAFIGTSNWSGDYFTYTAGVGIHIFQEQIQQQLKAIFLRDWESQYTHDIYDNCS